MTDVSLLCKNYLKGTCTKGKACKYHHNGPCLFHKKGNCKRGADCVYSHHAEATAAAAAPQLSAADKKKNAKAEKDAKIDA